MEHEWAPFGLPMVSANAPRPSGQIDAYPLYPIVSTLYVGILMQHHDTLLANEQQHNN